jgi:CHAD domain-containing protein
MGKNDRKANCLFGARYMLTQVEALQNEIQGALVGDDIEHVHQMRVASRRMRNALNLFGDCLSDKKAKAWGDEIRKITKSLGKARDLDIQIELINRCYAASLEDRYKPGYNRLLLRLKQQRAKAQEKVNRTLVNLQGGGILARMQAHLMAVTAGSENIYLYTPSLYQQAFETINRNLEEFLSYEKYIHDPQNIEELHAMRITGKHLRYTLEIFAPIYGTALDLHVRAMKNIQDLLGEIHDNDVWIAWLPKFIDQERARVEDYFGHTGPFRRLLPGLNHFIEDRQRVRDEEYQTFLSTWETLAYENAWMVLKEIIQAPINIEAVLVHMPPQAKHMLDEAQTQDDTAEFEVELTSEDLLEIDEPLPPIDSVDEHGEEF